MPRVPEKSPAEVIIEVSRDNVRGIEIRTLPEHQAFKQARSDLFRDIEEIDGFCTERAALNLSVTLSENAGLQHLVDVLNQHARVGLQLYESLKRANYPRAEEFAQAMRDELRVRGERLLDHPNLNIEVRGEVYLANEVKLGVYAAFRLKLLQIISGGLDRSNIREAQVLWRAMAVSPAGKISLETHSLFYHELEQLVAQHPELRLNQPVDIVIQNNDARQIVEKILSDLGLRVSIDQMLLALNDWRRRVSAYDDSPSESVSINIPQIQALEEGVRREAGNKTTFNQHDPVGIELNTFADNLAQIIRDSKTLDDVEELEKRDVWVAAQMRNLEKSVLTKMGVDFRTYITMILDPSFDPNAADTDAHENLQELVMKLERERNRLVQRRPNSTPGSRAANELDEDALAKIIGDWIAKAREASRKVGTRRPVVTITDEETPPNLAKPDIIKMYEKKGLSQDELMVEADKYLSALENSEEGTGNIKNRETVVYLDALQELLQGQRREYVRRRIRLYDAASYAGASKSMIVAYDVLVKGQDKSGDIWGGNGSNKFDEKDYDFFLREWDKRDEVNRVLASFAKLFSKREIPDGSGIANEFYAPNYRETEDMRNKLWAEVERDSGVHGDAHTIGIYLAICLDMRRYFATAEYARGWSPRHDFAATVDCIQKCNPSAAAAYKIAGKGEEPVNFALTFAAMPRQWIDITEFDLGAHSELATAKKKQKNLLLADEATRLYADTYAPIRQRRYQLINGKNPCPTLYEFFILRQGDRTRGKPMTLKDYFKGYESFGKLYEECAKTVSFTGDAKKDMDIILKDVRNIRENLFSGTKALPMIDDEYRAQMILSHIFMLFKEYNLKHPDGENLDSLKVAVRKLLEEGATFATGKIVDEDGETVTTQRFFIKRFPDYVAPGIAGRGTIITYALPGTLARKYAPILSPHSLDRTWARTTWAEFRRQNAQIELPEAPAEEKKK